MKRPFELTTPLGEGALLFYRMTIAEELGRLGQWELEALSEKGDIDLDQLLGKQINVTVERPDAQIRHFTGYVSRFAQTGMHGRLHRYRAVVQPWLWFLTRTSDCRIFQGKTAPEIIKDVFADHAVADYKMQLGGSYRKREYCVQYRETDFDFVSRLMEEEGIYYYFLHGERQNTLVLSDSTSAHSPAPGCEQLPYIPPERYVRPDMDHVHAWLLEREVMPGAYALTDYDAIKPSVDLSVKTKIQRKHDLADYEIFDYPGSYLAASDGDHYVRTRIEELHAQYELVEAETNSRAVACGRLLTLFNHPREDQNREYLVVSAVHELQSAEYESVDVQAAEYRCRFRVLESKQPFRPRQLTPKPLVRGPQTAVVVGPAGEEIYTDEYSRIKVQFHWDRYGKRDQNSSCWIRVAQPWAGKTWGAVSIPRIGQEVVVDFLEGDPSQPIVTGSVYNAEQMPPFALPSNKTQSGIRSRSTLGGGSGNCNELRFEDKLGAEHVLLHAEKDQGIEVENDETHWVGHNRTKTVDNDETNHIKHDRTETVDNNETIVIGVDRTEKVGSNETITIGSNRTESVGVDEKITIGANRTENVGADETITIGSNRTITVGSSETATVALQRTHTVGVNETITVGAAQEVTVGAAQLITVGAAQVVSVGLNQDVNVGANQSESVGSNQTVKVGGDQSSTVGKNRSAKVGADDTLNVSKNLVIDAGDSITIKTGDASITLKKDGSILIKGKNIKVDGSGKINVKADSDVVIKGSKIGAN